MLKYCETKRKISDALKNREFNEEWKNKISQALKGRKLTEEWRLKKYLEDF